VTENIDICMFDHSGCIICYIGLQI